MNHDYPAHESGADGLAAMRESMRRDLNRANTSVGIILVVVLGLAIVAVIAGFHAARNFRAGAGGRGGQHGTLVEFLPGPGARGAAHTRSWPA